jgi:glycosyltransferase involved in cell wall biosynthesis
MPAVFAEAHIVCLPSYREGLPKVLVEAAASARPIVATDVPGCREVVRDGWNGLLVPVRDAAALARAIRRLLLSPEERVQMGARGRALAEAEFTIERVIRETLAVYHLVVG